MKTIFNADDNATSVRLLKALEKWSIARTDLAITINQACAKVFMSRSCPPEKMAVVMNTPDTRIFQFQPPAAVASRPAGQKFVVMYHGTIVEVGPATTIISNPIHPYTQMLLASAPDLRDEWGISEAPEIRSFQDPPRAGNRSGCVFEHRCPHALPSCRSVVPRLRDVGLGHSHACAIRH